MKKIFKKNIYISFILFLLSMAALLPFTNRETGYTMPAEYRWTLPTVVSTVLSGSIAVPELWGKPRFKKPPLGYWSMTLPAKLFGLKLFWVRMPIIIYSALATVLLFLFLRNLNLSRKSSFTGAVIGLSMTGYYIYSRIVALEIPMLFFTLGAFYGLSELLIKEKSRGIYIVAFFSSLTLLTKSHATAVSVLFFLPAWAVIYKRADIITRNKMKWAKAALLSAAVFLPWFIWLYLSYGPQFTASMRAELVGDRFTSNKYNFTGMLVGLLTLALPYTIIFLTAMVKAFKTKGKENVFLLLYVGSILFPYIFVKSHRMRYMVPILPAAAALIIFNYSRGPDKKFMLASLKITGVLAALISAAALAAALKIGVINISVFWGAFITAILLGIFLWKGTLLPTGLTGIVFNFLFLGFIYSGIGLWKVPDDLSDKFAGRRYSTLNRRPFFLPVKLRRLQFNDITGIRSFKEAAKSGSLIYFPEHRIKKLKKFMDASNYKDYDKVITWKRFNEVPSKENVIKAFREGNPEFLKEDTYFIKIKQS